MIARPEYVDTPVPANPGATRESTRTITPAPDTPDIEDQRLLLQLRTTWSVIGWWTLWYGSTSWVAEYLFAKLDPRGGHPFVFGLSRMVYAVYWGVAAVVAVAMTDWRPITSRRQYARFLLHFVVCLLVLFAWASASYYTNLAIVPGWQPLGVGQMLASTAKNVFFGYGFLLVTAHIVLQLRRHRARELTALREANDAAQAQLQVLKMELQPHFLFNALHAVSALMHTDVRAANETLVRVSDMLRHAVDTSRVQEVPLRDELAAVQLYTQIEQVRFGERLRLTWDVAADVLDAAVPHMLLQPLVENAIKHGLEVRSDAGRITVTARRDGDMLCLNIRDDGPGLGHVSPRRGAGVGLTNVRTRLAHLYGDRYAFRISDAPGGGAEVVIQLPLVVRHAPHATLPSARVPQRATCPWEPRAPAVET